MIMPNNTPTKQKKTPKPRKRVRLTPKQVMFIDRILSRGYTVEAAMDELGIWPRLLDDWLRQPRFNQAIDFKLNQYHLQTRINAALFAPRAVRTLGYMFDTRADYETKRKASVDLLRVLDSCKTQKESPAAQGRGPQEARSGSPRAQAGTPSPAAAPQNSNKIVQNPRFQFNNAQTD